MSGKAFVGQGAKKLQAGGAFGVVNVDYIGSLGIHRRSQIKGRAQEFFHRGMNLADFIGDLL